MISNAASLDAMQMFLGAEPVVKVAMLGLTAASVTAWAILFVMLGRIMLAKRRMRASIANLRSVTNLTDAEALFSKNCQSSWLLEAAVEETRLSNGLPADNIVERAKLALARVEHRIYAQMTFGLGLLAIIGSTGPFVGLFGTIWGIMHSFVSIANSHTTNLSVVAPGIAEALLATAIGLVAAIPAVVFYNILTRQSASYRALVGDAESLILRHLSRDLDRRDQGPARGGYAPAMRVVDSPRAAPSSHARAADWPSEVLAGE